jgi:hypothetical protein
VVHHAVRRQHPAEPHQPLEARRAVIARSLQMLLDGGALGFEPFYGQGPPGQFG